MKEEDVDVLTVLNSNGHERSIEFNGGTINATDFNGDGVGLVGSDRSTNGDTSEASEGEDSGELHVD